MRSVYRKPKTPGAGDSQMNLIKLIRSDKKQNEKEWTGGNNGKKLKMPYVRHGMIWTKSSLLFHFEGKQRSEYYRGIKLHT